MKVYTAVMTDTNGRIFIADRNTHPEICDVIKKQKELGYKMDKPIVVSEVTNEYEILKSLRFKNVCLNTIDAGCIWGILSDWDTLNRITKKERGLDVKYLGNYRTYDDDNVYSVFHTPLGENYFIIMNEDNKNKDKIFFDNAFEEAIYCMIIDNGYCEALAMDKMTPDQKERFSKIKDVYLEEKLKDCKF